MSIVLQKAVFPYNIIIHHLFKLAEIRRQRQHNHGLFSFQGCFFHNDIEII